MAIGITYDWPVATPGTTTPPSSSTRPPTIPTSSVAFNEVVAAATGDGVSTTLTITHNLELTAQELTASWPEVKFEPQVSGAPSGWTISKASNTVTVGFSAVQATSIGVFQLVRITRPYGPSR